MCHVTWLCVVTTRPWEVPLCVMSLCMCYVIGRRDYEPCHVPLGRCDYVSYHFVMRHVTFLYVMASLIVS